MTSPLGPNINLKQLKAVQAVARYSSFIAAAAEMHMSQPGLSRLIRTVESEVGAQLFHRSTRHVTLTPKGAEFLPFIERILRDIELATDALNAADGQLRGYVSVSCPMSIAHRPLARIVCDYRQRFPNVTIEVREGLQGDVISEIHSGGVDFGIAIARDLDEDLVATELCRLSYHVVFRKDHRFLQRKVISLEDLQDETLVSLPSSSNLRWLFDGAAARAGFRLNHAITVNTYNTIFEIVRVGGTVSILNADGVGFAADEVLATRPIDLGADSGRLATIRLRKRPLTPSAHALKQMVDNYFYAPDAA